MVGVGAGALGWKRSACVTPWARRGWVRPVVELIQWINSGSNARSAGAGAVKAEI
jgi:hypothetical protein